MAFPTSPTNGATAVVNGITYTYEAANNAWTRTPVLFDNLTVSGNLTVLGTETILSVNNLSVSDSLIYLSNDTGGADLVDIGFVGHFVGPGYQHTGLVRDATDKTYKLFDGVADEPTSSTLDFSSANYTSFRAGNIISIDSYAKSVFAHVSTANALITAGNITGVGTSIGMDSAGAINRVANVYSTYGNFTNLTTANARLTGGSITGVTGAASTFTATNFSSGNAEIVSPSSHIGTDSAGAVSRVANVYANLGNFTDFSTANAVISGGSTGTFTNITGTNFSTANALISGGSVTGITGAATTLVSTNFSSGNAQITGGSITGITGSATTLQATNFSSGNISITGGNIILGAGTTSVAPLRFSTGGALHSTAAAGMVEYTTLFHGTTQGTERGLIAAAQYYVLNANRGLATAVTTQTLFNQTFKVTSSTRYYYEAFISISKTNATANTLQYAIVVADSAVLAAHEYSVMSKWAAARTTVTAMNEMSNSITTGFNTLVSVSAASAAAAATVDARIQGFIDVTTGGTINPQIALATNATTAPTLLALSYWKMYPVGAISANTSIQ